jgi:hypothetical protein
MLVGFPPQMFNHHQEVPFFMLVALQVGGSRV